MIPEFDNQSQQWAVLFDMDGVIVDTVTSQVESIQILFRRKGRAIDDKTIRRSIFGRANPEWIPDYFPDASDFESINAIAAEKETIFRELFLPNAELLPGLGELLEELHSTGVPMAIVSMAPLENVNAILDATKAKGYFRAVLSEENVKRGKPDPEIYRAAANALCTPCDRCIVFEDAPIGIEAGHHAGCLVIGVQTTHSAKSLAKAEYIIPNFCSLTAAKLAEFINFNR